MEIVISLICAIGGFLGISIPLCCVQRNRRIREELREQREREEREQTEILQERARMEREEEERTRLAFEQIQQKKKNIHLKDLKHLNFKNDFSKHLNILIQKYSISYDQDTHYYFLYYLGCHFIYRQQPYGCAHIKMFAPDNELLHTIFNIMDEIGDIIETHMNINIGVHGNFIIKRNEGIFKNIYEKKDLLFHESYALSKEVYQQRLEIYNEAYKLASDFFDKKSDTKNLLKKKFLDLLFVLDSY